MLDECQSQSSLSHFSHRFSSFSSRAHSGKKKKGVESTHGTLASPARHFPGKSKTLPPGEWTLWRRHLLGDFGVFAGTVEEQWTEAGASSVDRCQLSPLHADASSRLSSGAFPDILRRSVDDLKVPFLCWTHCKVTLQFAELQEVGGVSPVRSSGLGLIPVRTACVIVTFFFFLLSERD